MTDDVIPQDIRKFILQNIDSIAQLEGLLQFRADPAVECSAGAMARKLYITVPETEKLLDRLMGRGFLVASGKDDFLYRYQPQTQELELMVDRVADLYARYLIPLTHLIHSRPKNRIREFADAFRIRKDKD